VAKQEDPYERMHRKNAQKAWVIALMEEAQKNKWYGKLTITIERGEAVRAVKEESILPPGLRKKSN
jgi:hypothetical protein